MYSEYPGLPSSASLPRPSPSLPVSSSDLWLWVLFYDTLRLTRVESRYDSGFELSLAPGGYTTKGNDSLLHESLGYKPSVRVAPFSMYLLLHALLMTGMFLFFFFLNDCFF